MPKINQEEYELLKKIDIRWKWIARDNNNTLWIYAPKPRKNTSSTWQISGKGATRVDTNLFQFIQWEDEEPYNIAELIEEYEFENVLSDEERFHELYNVNESEESEVKNIEELKSWFEGDKFYEGEYVNHKIDQLDEPEVLSREFINEKAVEVYADTADAEVHAVFRMRDLQNLLVRKQELPVIPKFVADYLCRAKADVTLMRVLEIANTRNELPKWKKEYDWISANDETFARAWLDGYTVEEQRYYVLDKDNIIMIGKVNNGKVMKRNFHTPFNNFNESAKEKAQLTEQEIKDYDPRYWAFAEPIEEADFRLLF